jgi:thiol:disulfide interchange protein
MQSNAACVRFQRKETDMEVTSVARNTYGPPIHNPYSGETTTFRATARNKRIRREFSFNITMNRHKLFAIVAALLGSATSFLNQTRAADFPKGSPEFVTSYAAALKASKISGKPVVLIFSAAWCPPCQSNKHNVYPSAAVQPFHDRFVWAYLDADEDANIPVMRKFGVTGIPHIQFLDKTGKSLGSAVGGTTPEEFAKTLEDTLKRARS